MYAATNSSGIVTAVIINLGKTEARVECAVSGGKHFMGIVFFGKPAKPTAGMEVPKRKKGLTEPILTTLP